MKVKRLLSLLCVSALMCSVMVVGASAAELESTESTVRKMGTITEISDSSITVSVSSHDRNHAKMEGKNLRQVEEEGVSESSVKAEVTADVTQDNTSEKSNEAPGMKGLPHKDQKSQNSERAELPEGTELTAADESQHPALKQGRKASFEHKGNEAADEAENTKVFVIDLSACDLDITELSVGDKLMVEFDADGTMIAVSVTAAPEMSNQKGNSGGKMIDRANAQAAAETDSADAAKPQAQGRGARMMPSKESTAGMINKEAAK